MFEFFDSIRDTILILKRVVESFLCDKYQKIAQSLSTTNYEEKAFRFIFFMNRVKEYVNSKFVWIYNNNRFVQLNTNRITYFANYVLDSLQSRRTEPFIKSWLCISALTKSYHNYREYKYNYNELYDTDQHVNQDKTVQVFKETFDIVKNIVSTENAIAECLLSCKYEGKLIHRICNPALIQLNMEPSKIIVETSDIKFLSIEYHSKDYVQSIVLELGNNEYLVNNEILSVSHVKRLLEYQVPYHRFDTKYTILLVDNNLSNVSLNFGDYIVLHKTFYSIMNEKGVFKNIYGNCFNATGNNNEAANE